MYRLKECVAACLVSCLTIAVLIAAPVFAAEKKKPSTAVKHFDKKGKPPSTHTIALHKKLQKSLPFTDKRDVAEAKRGFIAAPASKKIKAQAGHTAWDMARYAFLLKKDATYHSIHPSLMRQAKLNMSFGLYEVLKDKIYQVRGFVLANITFVRSKTGWIVFDPLTAAETAKAKVVGHQKVLQQLASTLHEFELGFEMMPGTKTAVAKAASKHGPYKVDVPAMKGE